MTVCPDAMLEVAKFAAAHDRLFTMNLSAPFLCTAFKDQLASLLPYVDILFGNELVSSSLLSLVIKCYNVQGVPKKQNPGFNFAITSVNVHRF